MQSCYFRLFICFFLLLRRRRAFHNNHFWCRYNQFVITVTRKFCRCACDCDFCSAHYHFYDLSLVFHSCTLTPSLTLPSIRNFMFIMGFVWMCINPSQARKKPAIIHCHLFRAKHLKRMPFNRVSTRTHNSCDQPFLVDETAATNIISALFFLLLYLFGDFVFSFNMIVDRLLLLYSSFFLLQSTPALPHFFLHRFMQTVISLK